MYIYDAAGTIQLLADILDLKIGLVFNRIMLKFEAVEDYDYLAPGNGSDELPAEIMFMSAISTQIEDLHWLVEYEAIVEVVPIPLCLLAILSSLISYITACNMKSEQASMGTLKYMAVFDLLHSLDMIQSIVVKSG